MSALTPDDIAEDLTVTRDTVMAKFRAGEIPGFRVGRAWRVDADVYAEWKRRPAVIDPYGIEPMNNRSAANIGRART